MGLITTAEELADAIVTDPERVAACLGRINRFGGQVPHCTVLRHSLHVFERIDADFDSSDAARLWALLHDVHEVLTGDVVRWEVLEIGQGKAPYSLYQFPAKSWADLVRELITIGGAA